MWNTEAVGQNTTWHPHWFPPFLFDIDWAQDEVPWPGLSQAAKQYKWELNEARDKLLMSRCQVLKEASAGLGWAGLGWLGWAGPGWAGCGQSDMKTEHHNGLRHIYRLITRYLHIHASNLILSCTPNAYCLSFHFDVMCNTFYNWQISSWETGILSSVSVSPTLSCKSVTSGNNLHNINQLRSQTFITF